MLGMKIVDNHLFIIYQIAINLSQNCYEFNPAVNSSFSQSQWFNKLICNTTPPPLARD